MMLNKLRDAILKGWIGQRIWYRYIKPPGAYCKTCGRYYSYRQYDHLPRERIYPQYMAAYIICECGSHAWRLIG